jgi:hypothetical protein
MKIKSLRLALCEGGNPEYPTGAGSSVNLWCGLDRRQGETTSAGDAPPVSATRERRARGIKIFGGVGSGEQRQPTQHAGEHQVRESNGHGERSCWAACEP